MRANISNPEASGSNTSTMIKAGMVAMPKITMAAIEGFETADLPEARTLLDRLG